MKQLLLIALSWLVVSYANAQTVCASAANIYTFSSTTSIYEVVKVPKTWTAAAACAVELGGYLVEIGDPAEQTTVHNGVIASGVTANYSPVGDGGGASYLWIGANDKGVEGRWYWDGNNDQAGTNFYSNGFPVMLAFNNWGSVQDGGSEPDDFQGNQDAAAIALGPWPYGVAGQWNDIAETNAIYFVVEKPTSSTGFIERQKDLHLALSPNPVKEKLSVSLPGGFTTLQIYSVQGAVIADTIVNAENYSLDVSGLDPGLYVLIVTDANGRQLIRKITKE